jgi:malonyl-CoA O-methyltransferase
MSEELDKAAVQSRFDRAAGGFDGADFVHRHVADGLLGRIEPMQIAPRSVVDLGCATGAALPLLEKRYRKALVVGVDRSPAMLDRAHARRGLLSRIRTVRADAERLPFADHSLGLVFSNLLLPWLPQPDTCFAEVSRTLEDNGLFAFSTLGPDSFEVIRDAFGELGPNINAFADMHDIGDGLVRAGLRDPVLDVDRLTVTYESAERLFEDLTRSGARNALIERRRGMPGRRQFARAVERLGRPIRVELELVYGHAWGSGRTRDAVRIPAGGIPVRRR